MPRSRLLPSRSPVSRAQRLVGAVPHGLPTASVFSGAAAAVIVGSVVGVSAALPSVLPRPHGPLRLPGATVRPGSRPDPARGGIDRVTGSAVNLAAAVPAVVGMTGAGGGGGRTSAATATRHPGATPSPAPRHGDATPTPVPAGHRHGHGHGSPRGRDDDPPGKGEGHDHGRATPAPTASPTPVVPTVSPTPTPRDD
jgi:hypothetical protein